MSMTASLTAGNNTPALDNTNPYIGPRPFGDNARERRLFFGRDRESADLLSLALSERLVLFYAPSGAGKSSLINARLLPALRDEGFTILGTVRVGGQLPDKLPLNTLTNVYIFNLLRDLADERSDRSLLTTQRLPDYLAALPSDPARPDRMLILDQFEEIFTTYEDQWEKREDFFRQLSQALADDPHLWVMITLREDYIAELDPYARLLPNRLRVRYRLKYMDAEAALEAVKQPVALAKRPFEPGVAENLVNNLRQMTTGDAANEAPKLGETIEPVQLQVVCMQLWENLRDRPGATITAADVESLARGAGLGEFVNHALASFYEQTLAAVALAETGVSEREIRDWFSQTLITRDGTRNLLYQSERETGGLPNAVAFELERRFLLRGETRSGGRWVELVHDRLIAPIRDANAQWRRRHPLVIAADLWHADRRPSLLLSAQALVDAQAELARYPERYSDVERHFVATSADAEAAQLKQQQIEEEKRRQKAARDRIIALGAAAVAILMFLLLVMAIVFAFQSFQNSLAAQNATRIANEARDRANTARDDAIKAEQRASEAALQAEARATEAVAARAVTDQLNRQIRADQLASQSVLALEQSPQQALLLSVEAMRMDVEGDAQLSHAVEQSIHDVLHATGGAPATTITDDAVALVLGADGSWFSAASADGALQAWRLDDGGLQTFELASMGEPISWALAASSDGRLAAAGDDGTVRVWQMADPNTAPQQLSTDAAPLYAVALSADGRWLAAAGENGNIYLWDTSAPDAARQTLTGHTGAANVIAFSPDGQWLASGGGDGALRLWATATPAQEVASFTHTAPITGIVFSPDGTSYAAGDQLGGVRLYPTPGPDLAKPANVVELPGHNAPIRALDFSSNGLWLATGDENGVARVWNLKDAARSYVVRAHTSSIRGLAFVRGASGEKLVTAGDDGPGQSSVRLWDYTDVGAMPVTVRGHDGIINLLATTRGLNGFLTAGYDHFVRIWLVDDPQAEPSILVANTPFVDELQAPDDEALYAVGGETPGVQTWLARGAEAGALLTTTNASSLSALAVSADGALRAAGDAGGTIYLWEQDTVTPVAIMTGHAGRVTAVALHPAGRLLASAGDDGAVRLWNLDTAAPLHSLREEGARVTAMSFDAAGDQLAIADSDGVLTLWAVAGLDSAPREWRAGAAEVTSLAFSPDALQLAAGDRSGQLWVWKLASPDTPAQHWQGHINEVSTVIFGDAPGDLISASADRTVRLWNLEAPLPIPTVLSGHTAAVNSVDFADGAIFTVSTDGTLRAWLLAPTALAERACTVAGRNLDQAEWDRYLPDMPCRATCPDLPDRCGE
jgi:WD40 repeat protein